MVFSSTEFLFFFFPFVLIVYFISKKEIQNIVFLLLSLTFYAFGEPKFFFILIFSIIFNHCVALVIETFKDNIIGSRFILIIALIANLGLLYLYKYLDFTVYTFNLITHSNYNSLNLSSHLLLGVSFFTFQSLSYILDVYFQSVKAEKNIIKTGLYIAFFPKLLMGPIAKYKDMFQQIDDRTTSVENFVAGSKRFIIGFIKKIVLSVPFGVVANYTFSDTSGTMPALLYWVGIVFYCFQLFYDFSGYSDMAIGLGRMFGFNLPENFDYPYISRSTAEYWRRWHITLGYWFRDYLYTPLFRTCMNIRNPFTKKTISLKNCDLLSLLVLWILVGMWHGAGGKFIVYGLWWFVFIVLERLYDLRKKKLIKQKKLEKKPDTLPWIIMAHIYTIFVIILGQVIFRASSLTSTGMYYKSMFGLNGNPLYSSEVLWYIRQNFIYMIFAFAFSTPIVKVIKQKYMKNITGSMFYQISSVIAYGLLFILGLSFMIGGSQKGFIYFNF